MSLEQVIAENNALLRELIDLQKAGAVVNTATTSTSGSTDSTDTTSAGATTGAKGKGAKGKSTAASKPKVEVVDPDTLKAKLVEYKNLTDLKAAKALTKELGYDAIADVPDDKSKEFYDAVCDAIAALDNGNEPDVEDEEAL